MGTEGREVGEAETSKEPESSAWETGGSSEPQGRSPLKIISMLSVGEWVHVVTSPTFCLMVNILYL